MNKSDGVQAALFAFQNVDTGCPNNTLLTGVGGPNVCSTIRASTDFFRRSVFERVGLFNEARCLSDVPRRGSGLQTAPRRAP